MRSAERKNIRPHTKLLIRVQNLAVKYITYVNQMETNNLYKVKPHSINKLEERHTKSQVGPIIE